MKNLIHILLAISISALLSCNGKETNSSAETRPAAANWNYHPELKYLYDTATVSGGFVIEDENNGSFHASDSAFVYEAFPAASTFKIPNSLISLECGSVKDENEVLKWDGVKRSNEKWNADTDMKTAMKNSTVWFYQELARRNGRKNMKNFLDKMHYGNADTSGGIDKFWLSGGLRISPLQQIEFLKKLKHDSLPFSKRNLNIVKRIIIREETSSYVMRWKTGWGTEKEKDVCWLVGYLEKGGNTFYFANLVSGTNLTAEKVIPLRENILRQVLSELNILPRAKAIAD